MASIDSEFHSLQVGQERHQADDVRLCVPEFVVLEGGIAVVYCNFRNDLLNRRVDFGIGEKFQCVKRIPEVEDVETVEDWQSFAAKLFACRKDATRVAFVDSRTFQTAMRRRAKMDRVWRGKKVMVDGCSNFGRQCQELRFFSHV